MKKLVRHISRTLRKRALRIAIRMVEAEKEQRQKEDAVAEAGEWPLIRRSAPYERGVYEAVSPLNIRYTVQYDEEASGWRVKVSTDSEVFELDPTDELEDALFAAAQHDKQATINYNQGLFHRNLVTHLNAQREEDAASV